MGFQFRLQKILDIKEKDEDNKKNEASIANKKLIEAKQQLADLYEEHKQRGAERVQKNNNGCQLSEIMEINSYIEYFNKAIDQKRLEIQRLEREVEQKKEEYLESRKSRKTYDNLKEKKYQAYLQEEKKEEEKIIDQIVSYSYSKKEK